MDEIYDNNLTLKELRLIRNIQQKYMMERLNLSQNGYKKKESGEREFYISELEILCDIFSKSEKDMIRIIKNSKEK